MKKDFNPYEYAAPQVFGKEKKVVETAKNTNKEATEEKTNTTKKTNKNA